MKKRGLDCVFLDISHKGEEFIRGHFPNIHARCLELGIDITQTPIPRRASRALHLRRHRQRPARAHRCPGSMLPGKHPAPACMAPIAWPPIPCSNAWFLPKLRSTTF
jgi:hypothetical protein